MTRAHRISIVGGVIVCLLSTQWSAMLFASGATVSAADTPAIASSIADAISIDQPKKRQPLFTFDAAPGTTRPLFGPATPGGRPALQPLSPEFTAAAAGQVYRGRPHRMQRDGSMAAVILGAAAAITGTAILVYANRPECSANPSAGGCGYGTKVVGTSVLVGGTVGVVVGTLTW